MSVQLSVSVILKDLFAIHIEIETPTDYPTCFSGEMRVKESVFVLLPQGLWVLLRPKEATSKLVLTRKDEKGKHFSSCHP